MTQVLGFRVRCLGFRASVSGLMRLNGFGFRTQSWTFRAVGLGVRSQRA